MERCPAGQAADETLTNMAVVVGLKNQEALLNPNATGPIVLKCSLFLLKVTGGCCLTVAIES